ncbi:MAG: TAT-variant-translocated molybdopterin oxidoreductase [bacterium]|nr:TAT-variant-translocated molybdopterin oxidoreductase [bacterium]
MSEIKNTGDRQYWRSIAELTGSEVSRRHADNEFPGGIAPPAGDFSRRRFLQIMSASVALGSLAGCRWPEERIIPFASRPEGMTPGTPLAFATAMELGPVAQALVATSYDGRPIKVDGNPDFHLSGGGSSAMAQASVLDLYDPDRSRGIVRRQGGESPATWDDFAAFADSRFGGNLDGVALLTEVGSSPSHWEMLERATRRGARLYYWEPVCRINEIRGAQQAFGQPAKTVLDVSQAQVIVDFDANLLQDHPTALRNTRQFVDARDPESGHMNRLYCFENSYSITGGMADHRFPTPARDIGFTLWALAAELVFGQGLELPSAAGIDHANLRKWRNHPAGGKHIAALASDLMTHRGQSLLLAGMRQEPAVHTLIHVLNTALGNVGRAISYLPLRLPAIGDIKELAEELNRGRVNTLVLLGGNPVHDAPVDLDFAAAMMRAQERIHLSTHDNATSRAATWHLNRAHYLESWGDATAWDDTHLSVQPLIEPLFAGKTGLELLSLIVDDTPRTSYQIVRDGFHRRGGGRGPAPTNDGRFEKRWREFIHNGFMADSATAPSPLPLAGAAIEEPGAGGDLSARNLEISFTLDQSIYDGRFANNAWLQETPDFMTKLTWDNAALIGPATADELGVKHGDLLSLEYGGRQREIVAYILPGQAKYSVTVTLGYGREDTGRVGSGAGFNVYPLRTWDALNHGDGLRITNTGRSYPLATTQDHHAIDASGAAETQRRVSSLVREANLDDYTTDPEVIAHAGLHHPALKSLWKEFDYPGYKWGKAIDLNKCTGCNACVVSCQAENNVAVVGKDEVSRGREMSWLRLDRYFKGDMDDPEVVTQPVGCVQCELAPCEQVCPVAATVHSDEGLNTMVYNRCVGTRYCSNNCPYKVRRFNWFNNFEDLTDTERLVLNPDVTVRARGVIEKCSYCTQRIEAARVAARVAGRKIEDGDITTACQQACPAGAIVFGDLNDPESRVSKLREKNRGYDLLAFLNIKPRTFYLAKIRNPNPKIASSALHGEQSGGHGNQSGGH